MEIPQEKIVEFLRSFALLTPVQQRIFIHCLIHCPLPTTGDIPLLAASLQLNPRTLSRAFDAIERISLLAACVKLVRFNPKEEILQYELDRQADYSAIGEEPFL